ncbi:MAG: hypothetical protein MI723_11865 [Caulobacterales bacterium]|nr:hypothetical protein [Caulobacterales bacterium]
MRLLHYGRLAVRKLTLPVAVTLAVADAFELADVIQTLLAWIGHSL